MADDRPGSYNVGRALQRLRKGRDWTLAAVAEKTGVAVSTLSKIENNQSSPSYDVLVRLANGLNMDLMELVRGESFSTFASGARAITRAGSGIPYDTPLGEYQALSSELAKKSMQPTLVRLPPGRQAPERMSCHGGEEFIYVLRGSMMFFMEPYSPAVLAQGDSVHFDSLMAHGMVALGEEETWILAVSLFDERINRGIIAPEPKPIGDARAGGKEQE